MIVISKKEREINVLLISIVTTLQSGGGDI